MHGSIRRALTLGAVIFVFGSIAVPAALAADVYQGYSRVGHVDAAYGGTYNVYEGYTKVGSVRASYGGRWDVMLVTRRWATYRQLVAASTPSTRATPRSASSGARTRVAGTCTRVTRRSAR